MMTGLNRFRQVRHFAAVISGIMLVIGATGCGGNSNDDGGVIAKVNGFDITMMRFLDYYSPTLSPVRTAEEEYITLEEKLDDLIRYQLLTEEARKDGFLKDPMFRRRLRSHNKTVLNQLVKLFEVDNTVTIENASVEAHLARVDKERHFLHIITTMPEAANQVAEMLTAGEDWGEVALQYSRDNNVSDHQGDIGWLVWDEGPLSMYREFQEIAYQIPVGTWRGPIQQGSEYHFIRVLEERTRQKGTPEDEWQLAYRHLFNKQVFEVEQELSNRFWEEGEYYLDEDQFRWLLDQIQTSFNANRNLNPVPVLTREDAKRVVVRSRDKPWTAEMLLLELELMSSPSRDNAETYEGWRSRVLGWVMTDIFAEYGRTKGYHNDPLFKARESIFINTALYAEQVARLRDSVERLSDEALEQYIDNHPEVYNIPETRDLVEVLVETREEAEEVLSQLRGGRDIEAIASERTIRPGFRNNSGRFNPIRKEEFGPLGEAVFETELNELGPIVETPLGFSVFRVTEIRPARQLKREDIKENLRENIFQVERQEVVDRFVEQARRKAHIWKDYQRLRAFAAEISAETVARDSTGTGSNQNPPPPELNL
ncbi:peptidyl-prolyl cis-trans isomerase [Gemmatimonadota bacterium]